MSRRPALTMPSWPRLRNRLIVALIVIVALVAGYMLWFRDSSLVEIEKVNVTGANVAPGVQDKLTAAATGLSTLHLDRGAIEGAVADDPIGRCPEDRDGLPARSDDRRPEPHPGGLGRRRRRHGPGRRRNRAGERGRPSRRRARDCRRRSGEATAPRARSLRRRGYWARCRRRFSPRSRRPASTTSTGSLRSSTVASSCASAAPATPSRSGGPRQRSWPIRSSPAPPTSTSRCRRGRWSDRSHRTLDPHLRDAKLSTRG